MLVQVKAVIRLMDVYEKKPFLDDVEIVFSTELSGMDINKLPKEELTGMFHQVMNKLEMHVTEQGVVDIKNYKNRTHPYLQSVELQEPPAVAEAQKVLH